MGGGPTGLAAAIRPARHNKLSPVIYELRNPETAGIGGSLGIPADGVRVLHRLDLWDMILPRSISVECLRAGTQKYQIPIHYDKKITSIDHRGDSVTVQFSDGTSDTASLLLGCDGIHSAVRKMHVDPGVTPVCSGISAISSIVDDVIDQDPMETDCLHSTITPHGMLATAPCAAKQIFWFFSKEVPLPKGTSSADVRDGWLLHRQKELAHCRTRGRQPGCAFLPALSPTLRGSVVLPSGTPQGSPRVLLVGNAAHAIQPHAGQSVALALENVLLLSGLLAQYQGGDYTNLEEVFTRFDRLRRPLIQRIDEVALRNGRMRRNQSPGTVWCKEWYMWIMLHVNCFWGMSMSGVLNGDVLYDVEEELKQPYQEG
ncbi:uncharacterized protein N7477_000933 [Penicillium maclennaniae]|uniref:uncharacterized protein n=1 Tax=Penicillium maclennaniae TaxID=1343394 RepID=UPI0025400A7D|nr:uncharacterized protein N7477_000933 [Penicillium maclennaniae]KAJ5684588.1 hypothetical protein N7477_000933 [Penicillium maclennaniae]